jgi:D-alanyl-D-alanine dipeptidase
MVLEKEPNGGVRLSWPEGLEQDRYLVQVLRGQEILTQQWTEEASCILQGLPEESLDILVSSAKGYRFPFAKEQRIRMGEQSLKATANFKMPVISDLTCTPDPETQRVKLQFTLEENCICRMYLVETTGEYRQLQSLDQGEATLTLGDQGDFPVPQGDEKLTFAFDAQRFSPGAVYYGEVTQQVSVVREDLLQRDLALECQKLGNHVYSFTWGETKGEYYELQQFDSVSESWEVIKRVELDEARTYTTGHLPRYSDFRFRVVAVGGQTLPDSEYAAISEEIALTTENTAVFTTVWPIQELDFYKDAEKSQILGKAKATQALCVLDETNGLFRVRIDGQEGYIDSNYCLINLPEYLGDRCLYQITNSYSSLFMAHEYELPTITGKVLAGYGRVRMRSGEFLVPLLYPVAKRLDKAAQAAMEQGYKLKIYDAYRPQKATKAAYNQAIGLKDQPIPLTTYTGKVMTDLPQLEEGEVLTYGNLMTDFDRYTMNYFLAAGKSRHNRGIAIDLTLAEADTGKDLKMQTSMHDLSWYSESARDNSNAKKLASIMEGAGFQGLKSEWWHFHDLEVQSSLQPPYQMEGVTPECWMADDRGWRYRGDDGEYYVNCTKDIEGTSCTFDEQGYLVTG